jgi:SAM-dependent methyltransferase
VRKLYQNEWFGIKFTDLGVDLKIDKVADVKFYQNFYKEFFSKYQSYSDLPKEWRTLKDEIVTHIDELVNKKDKKILSIGCGTGYVENQLCDIRGNMEIIAIEPSVDMTRWINKKVTVLQGVFPSALSENYTSDQFDLVFASSIDYVFDDPSYTDFLKSVVLFGTHEFLLTEIFVPETSYISYFKTFIKFLLVSAKLRVTDQSVQLWGYLRTIEEHINFLKKAGFSEFDTGRYNHGAYWIIARVKQPLV